MSFKFTFLGLEVNNCESVKEISHSRSNQQEKKGLTKQQKKFKRKVQLCHKLTDTKEKFGKCLSRELRKKR